MFRDVRLDITDNNLISDTGLFKESTTNDIDISYDEAAIKNSLTNIFTTFPGQKLLVPDFGLNLYQFLFMPATQSMARVIGDRILEGINRFEPRVTVTNIHVTVVEEENTYEIDLTLKIPALSNSTVKFTGILQQPGFSFL
jgi:phage baseplate assembly protein W